VRNDFARKVRRLDSHRLTESASAGYISPCLGAACRRTGMPPFLIFCKASQVKHWEPRIRAFHASGKQAVLAITGGGSAAISRLLAVPGGSRSVLEAVVPYANASLAQWLGREPDAYCSSETALMMAAVAWQRAARLAGETQNVIGIACTAALASDQPKRGAHRCWIATQSEHETQLTHLALTKGARSRAEEEAVAADLILAAAFEAAGLGHGTRPDLIADEKVHTKVVRPRALIREVWTGHRSHVWLLPHGEVMPHVAQAPRGLIPGSFNPVHAGHHELRTVAEDMLGGAVAFELAIANADKPRLDFHSIELRLAQFEGELLAITGAPLFLDKARLFPDTTFVVGVDTAARLIDPRFYGDSQARMDAALAELRTLGARFLVAGRLTAGGFQTLADLTLPAGTQAMFTAIPEARFRADISSTALRLAAQAEPD
jgi:nicotinamide mononucleotide (NMN) deamidase PncC